MIQTHHCRKCCKVSTSRCFKKCGLQICPLHPNHAFGTNSTCRACPDPRDLVIEPAQEIKEEGREIDVLQEEWIGPEEQARVWKLIEQEKAQRGRIEHSKQAPLKNLGENNRVEDAVKGKRQRGSGI